MEYDDALDRSYSGPDEWISTSEIPWGVGSGKESIKSSWVATNRAAHLVLLAVDKIKTVVDSVQSAVALVAKAVDVSPGKVVDALVAKRWEFENQESKPPRDRGTNNLFEAEKATNGRVFHPVFGLEALSKKLAAIEAKVDALTPPQQ